MPTFASKKLRAAAYAEIKALCDDRGNELFAKIIDRADKVGGAYRAALDAWLIQGPEGPWPAPGGSTVLLRDELCSPFAPSEGVQAKLDHFNAFADIDTAGLKYRTARVEQGALD